MNESANSKVTAGVDLGGTKIQTVILRNRKVVGGCRELTPQTGVAGDVIQAMLDTIRASLAEASAAESEIGGVGIAPRARSTPRPVSSRWPRTSLASAIPSRSGRSSPKRSAT